MTRALVLLLPWMFVGGCATQVVAELRLPMTVTIGYELVFQELWEPVALVGAAVSVISLFPTLLVLLCRRDAVGRAELFATRGHPGARLVLVSAVLVGFVSHIAHAEAVRRSNEMQAVFMAELHDEPPPEIGLVRFHRDWRQTARLSRTLFLGSAGLFVLWILVRWGVAVRRCRARERERALIETYS